MSTPHFKLPLNLPHAARIAGRIGWWLDTHLEADQQTNQALFVVSIRLLELLLPYEQADENPSRHVAMRVRDDAARLGRKLVDLIEANGCGEDQLGQFVRNLFECLELGDEGARLSLRAGENPDSLMRPT